MSPTEREHLSLHAMMVCVCGSLWMKVWMRDHGKVASLLSDKMNIIFLILPRRLMNHRHRLPGQQLGSGGWRRHQTTVPALQTTSEGTLDNLHYTIGKRRMAATPDNSPSSTNNKWRDTWYLAVHNDQAEDGSDTRQQSQLYKQQVSGHLIPCTTQWPSGGWRRHQTTVPVLQTTSDGTLDTLHYTMTKRRMAATPDNSPSSTNNKWRDTWYLALHNDQAEDGGDTRQQSQLYKQQGTGHLIPCTTMIKRRMAATPDNSPSSTNNKWRDTWYLALHNDQAEDGSDTRQQSQFYKQQVTGHLIPCTTQWPSGGWQRHQTTVPALQTTSDGTLDTLHYTMTKRRMAATPDNSPSSTNNKWWDTWYLALHNDQAEDGGDTRQQSQLYKQQVTGHLIPCTTQWPSGGWWRHQSQLYKQQVTGYLIPCTTQWPSGGWQRPQTTVPVLQTTSDGTLDTLLYTMTKRRMVATPVPALQTTSDGTLDTLHYTMTKRRMVATPVPALQTTSDGTLDTLHYTMTKRRMAATPDNSPSSTNNKWRDTWYLALHNDQAEGGSDTRQQSQFYKQQVTGHLIPCTTQWPSGHTSPSSTNNKWRDTWYLALHNDQAEDGGDTRQQSQLYKQQVTGHLIPCTTQWPSGGWWRYQTTSQLYKQQVTGHLIPCTTQWPNGGWWRHQTTVPALQTTSDGTLDTLHYTMTKRRMAATPDNSPSSTNNKWRDTWYLALHNDQAEDGSDTRQQSRGRNKPKLPLVRRISDMLQTTCPPTCPLVQVLVHFVGPKLDALDRQNSGECKEWHGSHWVWVTQLCCYFLSEVFELDIPHTSNLLISPKLSAVQFSDG